MIRWAPGIATAPNGAPCRQLPEEHVWTTTRWVTKEGDVFRRRWDPLSKAWAWEDDAAAAGAPLSMQQDSGRMGVYNPSGWFMSLETVIATAWRRRAEGSSARVRLLAGKPLHARYLRWRREEAEREQQEDEQERWRALKWTIGPVVCDPRYQISSRGRLRAPDGRVTRGLYFRGRRWAAVADCGLVDLGAASGTQSQSVPPPRIRRALDAMATYHTPIDLAAQAGIKRTTAWAYYCEAVTWAKRAVVKRTWRRLVAPDLVKAIKKLLRQRDHVVFNAPLTELMAAVRQLLSPDSAFVTAAEEQAYAMLRFARTACVALAKAR